jgi:hypothetical protein
MLKVKTRHVLIRSKTMADITMCANDFCLRRELCYRQTATASKWQSMGKFASGDGSDCDSFWSNGKKAVKVEGEQGCSQELSKTAHADIGDVKA